MRLPTRKWLCVVLPGLLAVAAVAPASASASPGHRSPVVGHVYLDDNTAGENSVAGFDHHADGSLTAEPGSPFAAGGGGTGSGLASQGAIQISPDGRFVIAVDAGSDQISVLRIEPDGALSLVRDGVVSSGGALPVSVAVHDDLVYVANAGAGATNYSGFRLRSDGRLRPIPGATVPLPAGSQPGDVLFNRDGTRLVGTRVGTSRDRQLTVDSRGRLTAAPGSRSRRRDSDRSGASSARPRPTNSRLECSRRRWGRDRVRVPDGADGNLTAIGSSPFPDLQTAPCWVEITRDGRFLFTVNTASGTISRFSITRGGS